MKKIATLLLLLCSVVVVAQEKKHELKAMYSPFPLMKQSNWFNGDSHKNKNNLFMLEYNYFYKDRWKIGVALSYEKGYENRTLIHTKGGLTIEEINRGYPATITHFYYKNYYWSFTPQIGYEYLKTDNFRMGCALGLSLIYNCETTEGDILVGETKKIDVFGHVEFLNFTWGKTHGLTGQIGLGVKGLVSIGYFVKF